MQIPTNISKQHILQAINKIDNEKLPENSSSKFYDLIFDGKRYPPKLVFSYANVFANNKQLDRTKFRGGKETDCFKILEREGFIIERKSFYPTLIAFLERAKTDNQKHKDLEGVYNGTNVKVSFGQGNLFPIP